MKEKVDKLKKEKDELEKKASIIQKEIELVEQDVINNDLKYKEHREETQAIIRYLLEA